MKRKESIPITELYKKTELIKVKKDNQGYWLFGETDPEFYKPEEIKPLKKGYNFFERLIDKKLYFVEITINDKSLTFTISESRITMIVISKMNFKLKDCGNDEWETKITPQMLFWLSDFNLLKE